MITRIKLQRKILAHLKKEVAELLGKPEPEIKRYQKEYLRTLKKKFRPTQIKTLIETIQKQDVTFIGDFHSYNQAQRTALRIIRESVKPNQEWIIGLEMVASCYQKYIDQYLSDKIDDEVFLQLIRYHEKWGFPWSNYKPIFDWSKKNGIKIVGLNRPYELETYASASLHLAKSKRELKQRDDWTAGVITDLFAEHKKLKMICLYGEWHLGDGHLPLSLKQVSKRYLKRQLSSVSVFQNEEPFYWEMAQSTQNQSTVALRASKQHFMVLSGTPWNKLESVREWIDGTLTQVRPDEDDDPSDPASQLTYSAGPLKDFFKLDHLDLSQIHIYTPHNPEQIFLNTPDLPPKMHSWIKHCIAHRKTFYLPHLEICYIAKTTYHHYTEAVGRILFYEWTFSRLLIPVSAQPVWTWCLEACFSFLCSLLINPKRKCDLELDHKEAILELKQKARKPEFSDEIYIRQAVLDVLKGDPTLKAIESRSRFTHWMFAQYLGSLLAKKFDHAMKSQKTPDQFDQEAIKALMIHPARKGQSQKAVIELTQTLAKIKISKSKREFL